MVIGHPFDTAKILLQNNKKWYGLKPTQYYKGWKFPLTSSILYNFTVFPIYERTLKYTNNSYLSGAISGLAVAPIVFSFDIGKIKQQTNQKLCFQNYIKNKGLMSVTTREVLAMSIYFGSYNYLKNYDVHPLIAGGLAGLSNWTVTYPIDVVMSRQIAQNITIKKALQQGNLWRGYTICAIRAVIVNAANFYVYELVTNSLKNK